MSNTAAEQMVSRLRTTADIDDDVADMIRRNTPVSADERLMAEQ